MDFLWIGLALLVAFGGLRDWARVRALRSDGAAPVDDDAALRRILDEGSLAVEEDDDEPLDLDAIEREEESFWAEDWEEPEEF